MSLSLADFNVSYVPVQLLRPRLMKLTVLVGHLWKSRVKTIADRESSVFKIALKGVKLFLNTIAMVITKNFFRLKFFFVTTKRIIRVSGELRDELFYLTMWGRNFYYVENEQN